MVELLNSECRTFYSECQALNSSDRHIQLGCSHFLLGVPSSELETSIFFRALKSAQLFLTCAQSVYLDRQVPHLNLLPVRYFLPHCTQPVLPHKPRSRFQRVRLVGKDNLQIEAELASIPVGDSGDIAGDLMGLKLNSTDPNADTSNVFCSESMGCMRMEAGAQSSRTYQVIPLSDQSAGLLLSQQLQRWGREVLFEESLALTAEILKLNSAS